MNSIKHFIVLGSIIFATALSTYAQKPKVKIGIGVSHLYDLYEGPIDLISTSGNVTYTVTDIDLKGLNGDYSNFDLALTVLIELKINQNTSLTSSYTKGTMTSQFDNQYAISDLDILNVGYRRYFNFYSDSSRARLLPFVDLSAGLTLYTAERNFVKDQSLFSRTESSTINTSISAGCLIKLNRKISIIAAPNFIVNYSDAIDGYENQGVDIMLSSTIALIYKL